MSDLGNLLVGIGFAFFLITFATFVAAVSYAIFTDARRK